MLQGAQQYDLDCLAEIYDQYSPAIYAYAMRLLGHPNAAEECVADTFARLLKAFKAGQGPDIYLRAYLYRIAHNWITDYYRRQPPAPLELDENLTTEDCLHPERETERRLQQQTVRRALRCLTPDQRQVIVLRFLEGQGQEQVAAALQKPVGAVKALQHRALASLRRMLGQEEGAR